MYQISLDGLWEMSKKGTDRWFDANVPTTMYQVLLENGEIPDPFVGENDRILTAVSDDDYTFKRVFEIDASLFANEHVEMIFEGLDTLATVFLNGKKVLKAENMHRTYVIDVKDKLVTGENTLQVEFASPTKYIEQAYAKDPIWGIENPIDGYSFIRKAHHMFGWDWGPQLPDMGIWRSVSIVGYEFGKIEDFYVTQKHEDGRVTLDIQVDCDLFGNDDVDLVVALGLPKGGTAAEVTKKAEAHNVITIEIEDPQLWWPNGYGDQPLYTLLIELVRDGKSTHLIDKKIGLRTMTMTREADKWGESFDMTVNGVRIFAMGADYIPEDALICRMNEDRTRILLEDCVNANFNHIRVWGGAFYPGDEFYDLCDELGLLVWQDFMFACGVYRLTKKFEENITAEFIDNIKRIRHHACLGLWCGNNEMEWGFVSWEIPKDENLRLDYLRMYERLIPDVLEEYDPNNYYWPASPSSGGGFVNPNGDDKGDVHYWEVFHGNKHYKEFRKHYFRFASEYGMQSFPEMKTIEGFSEPGEREIYGPVMENHNKCLGDINGNMKIMMNTSAEFNLPANLEDTVYISQVFQGETIRCAVEHMRRHRGRCMGSTFWQVNDNWPVASWASIDVHGRWKGLQYMVKRFYAPVHASAYEEGMEGHIHVSNERMTAFDGTLAWQVRHVTDGIVKEGTVDVHAEPLSSMHCVTASIADLAKAYADERDYYLSYQLIDTDGNVETSDILLYVSHKHFNFLTPEFEADVIEMKDGMEIHITASEMAKTVGITFNTFDALLSDNFFDMLPGETKVIHVEEFRTDVVTGGEAEAVSAQQLLNEMVIKSVNSLSYIG